MTEIPDDVMKAARKVVIEDLGIDIPGSLQAAHIDCVAEAILAERERCAKLASDAADEFYNDAKLLDIDQLPNTADRSRAQSKAARIIVRRINNS